jgi:tripartite-type tricarboxylate transporter receptor subunit TctC
MKMQQFKLLSGALLASTLAVVTCTTQAQSYPSKTVRMIVPFAPGGNTDIIVRIVAPGMSKALGQQIIIDNRGGAGSMLGTDMAAKSPPDGYTLLMVSAAHVINPAMVKKLPFDPVKSFAAISKVADVPSAIVVHPSLPVKNAKQLIALAKASPGKLNYGSAGRGSIGHLSAELLGSVAQIKMNHVPYKGAGPALVDTMAGHVELLISSMPAIIGQSRAGKLRMIAQGGDKRSSIDRVLASLKSTLTDPTVRERLSGEGADPVGSSPEEYEKFTREEIEKWIKVARAAGIQPE